VLRAGSGSRYSLQPPPPARGRPLLARVSQAREQRGKVSNLRLNLPRPAKPRKIDWLHTSSRQPLFLRSQYNKCWGVLTSLPNPEPQRLSYPVYKLSPRDVPLALPPAVIDSLISRGGYGPVQVLLPASQLLPPAIERKRFESECGCRKNVRRPLFLSTL
jgi:hypothetical protein